MHHLAILSVGKVKDSNLKALCDGFAKRLTRYATVQRVSVKDVRSGSREAAMAVEAERLEAKRPAGFGLVALDPAGRSLSSEALAAWLSDGAGRGRARWAFAVGGPWGLSPGLVAKADLRLSLSALTFTHEMAQMLLLEQLYRAMTILRGVPYHK